MGTTCRLCKRAQRTPARTLTRSQTRSVIRPLVLGLLGLWLLCAGGCAMIPFALTTTASLAMPQTASLALSGAKGIFNTAQLAA
ncbi:MAG: hypothetical protein C0405_12480, partial [Desulfovibrio sp.]|nr:hypothetical protein [Desulfovibrio sp.]